MVHPRKYDESNALIGRLCNICLRFDGVVEKEAWGECTFRVSGGKMFAMTENDHHHSGQIAVWVMAPPTVQETLIRSLADRFFKPPYVGAKGWVGVRLDANVDWDDLERILRDGYLMSVPAKFHALRRQLLQNRVLNQLFLDQSRERPAARLTRPISILKRS